jgi:hypothetical protein
LAGSADHFAHLEQGAQHGIDLVCWEPAETGLDHDVEAVVGGTL